jgi:hypothetical protein
VVNVATSEPTRCGESGQDSDTQSLAFDTLTARRFAVADLS